MYNSKDFSAKERFLTNTLCGSKIESMEYIITGKNEDNIVKIMFNNGAELSIVCFMRILKKKDVILTTYDYSLGENFDKYFSKRRKGIVNLEVKKITFNTLGDVVFYLTKDIKIQIFFDTILSENYFTLKKRDGAYEYSYSLSTIDDKIIVKTESKRI